MKTRKAIFYLFFILSIIGLILCPFGIINTMVSLKYETENMKDCISLVSGENLCITIRNLKISFIICLIVLIFLLYFKKRALEPKRELIN
jgi:ABC-type Mn2+/Zn2+ transport system permease subunit